MGVLFLPSSGDVFGDTDGNDDDDDDDDERRRALLIGGVVVVVVVVVLQTSGDFLGDNEDGDGRRRKTLGLLPISEEVERRRCRRGNFLRDDANEHISNCSTVNATMSPLTNTDGEIHFHDWSRKHATELL